MFVASYACDVPDISITKEDIFQHIYTVDPERPGSNMVWQCGFPLFLDGKTNGPSITAQHRQLCCCMIIKDISFMAVTKGRCSSSVYVLMKSTLERRLASSSTISVCTLFIAGPCAVYVSKGYNCEGCSLVSAVCTSFPMDLSLDAWIDHSGFSGNELPELRDTLLDTTRSNYTAALGASRGQNSL